MSVGKGESTHTNWNQDYAREDLDDLTDPVNQDEIAKDIHTILEIVTAAKKSRKEAYSFNPSKLKKEKRIKQAKKEIQFLKSNSSSLARENNVIPTQILKKEIKILEKTHKEDEPYAPKSKLFKKPTVQQREHISNFLQSIENMQDTVSLVKGLKAFNEQAEDEIKKLTKEIEADKYNYEI